MDRDEMEQRVFAVLRDENKTFVSSAQVIDWIQEADIDLAARLLNLQADLAGTVGVDGDIDLPADFIEMKHLRLADDDGVVNNDVEFVSDDVYHSQKDASASLSHTIGRVMGATIELYPTPASAVAFALRYYREPTVMSTGASVSDHPAHLHRKHILFARAEAYWKIGEVAMGDREWDRYREGLPEINDGRSRNRPGPLSLTPTAGAWDTDDGYAMGHL